MSELDNAYAERNKLVRFLAACFPSGIKRTEIEGWDPAWHNCVFIDTPVGQMSWHFHDRERPLFADLPAYEKDWDGHTTEQKYQRLEDLSHHMVAMDGGRPPPRLKTLRTLE